MNPYVILGIAIISEVFGSSMLKVSNGFKKLFPSIGVIIGMGIAFYCLSLSENNSTGYSLCYLVRYRHSFNRTSGCYRL